MHGLAEQLISVLGVQRSLYREISALQTELIRKLDDTNQLATVMELLSQKNVLLDAIRAQIQGATPLVDEWVRCKEQMVETPGYPEIEKLLLEIESLVGVLRNQDEEMIKRFEGMVRPAATPKDQQAHSRNMLNAFRALR
jgi:hypothetical protein